MYISNELLNIFGIYRSQKQGLTFYDTLQQFYNNMNQIGYMIALIAFGSLIVFQTLFMLKPKWPWHSLFFLLAIFAGFILDGWFNSFKKNSILQADWPNNIKIQSSLNTALTKHNFKVLLNTNPVLEVYFIINVMAMSILTVIESSIAIRMTEDLGGETTDKDTELAGVAATNIICGIFGLPPVSIPVCTNILMRKLGVTSQAYTLSAGIFLILSVWILPFIFNYAPMLIVTVFNISLGMSMFDMNTIMYYWKYNRNYFYVILVIIAFSFFVHIVFSMLLSWINFFALYLNIVKKESFSLIKGKDFVDSIRSSSFLSGILSMIPGVTSDESLKKSEYPRKISTLLDDIEIKGIVYQLRGRFNFIYYNCHLQNLTQLFDRMKESDVPIVIDFSDIWNSDREFIRHYQKFLHETLYITRRIYIYGIPKDAVEDNALERQTWIGQFDEEDRIIYKNHKIE